MPLPSPADLPDPGIEPVSPASPALAGGFFTTEPLGRPNVSYPEPPILVYSHLLSLSSVCLSFWAPCDPSMTSVLLRSSDPNTFHFASAFNLEKMSKLNFDVINNFP